MEDFELHPASLAAETTDYQAGTLDRISDAIGKGVPAAIASGGLSIYNTITDYVDGEQVNIENAVRDFGGDDMGDYYAQNKETIDLVGGVATMMVPGSLGIKALQLARTGNTLGNVGKFLNFTASRKNEYLKKALDEVAENGGTIANVLSRNRVRQLAWETADQALLGTAFEVAVVGTMHDSPMFDDWTMSDFGWNVALGAGLSGVIGGALGSLAAKGILKSAQREIEAQLRLSDTIFDPKTLGLHKGTESLILAENIALLPDGVDSIPFKYRVDGKLETVDLDISGAIKAAKQNATKQGTDELALKFNELAGGDARIGQAVFSWMQEASSAAKAAGKSPSETVQLLNGYLNSLTKIDNLDLEQMALDARKFYVRTAPLEGATPLERVQSMFAAKRTKDTSKQPYYLADDVTAADLKIGTMEDLGETNVRSAFRNNPELDAVQRLNGTVTINPYSSKIKKLSEHPLQHRMFVNLTDGSLSSEAIPVFGDIIQKGKLIHDVDFIKAGNTRFQQPATVATALKGSPLEASARYAWASQLSASQVTKLVKDVVDTYDLPMLTRIAELRASGQLSDTALRKIAFKEGKLTRTFDDIVDLNSYVEQRKLDWMVDHLGNWKQADGSVPSTDAIAAHVNATREWVEHAISTGFKTAPKNQTGKEAGKLLATADAMTPKTVQFTWTFDSVKQMLPEEAYNMNMGPSHLATKELTKEYQYAIRERAAVNAFESALGEDAALFMEAADHLARTSSQTGAGATIFGASNAGYGEAARLWAQDTGKNVALVTQRRRDAVVESLAPYINTLRVNERASAELGILTTALRKSEFRYVFDDIVPNRLVSVEAKQYAKTQGITYDEAIDYLTQTMPGRSPHSFAIESQEAIDFLRASTRINSARQGRLTTLYNAMGLTRNVADESTIYVPPINTVKYPYHAFVRTKEKVGLATDVAMITAKSEDQLRKLAAGVGDDYDVFYKADTEMYYKIKGEYDYQLTLNEARVNSDLARRGMLADLMPETNLLGIMEDYLEWHAKSEEKLVRTAVQTRNRQFFSEMQFLSNQYRKVSESVTRGIGSRFKSKVADPFGDYIKTSLNISKQQEFPLLDSLNEFVDKVSLTAGDALQKAFYDARKGMISYEDANKIADKYGLGMPYRNFETYATANEPLPRNIIREGLQKANLALATMVLRLDFANSLVNMISTPILLGTEVSSIKRLAREGSAEAGALKELMSVALPGNPAVRVPSTTKLIGTAIHNFFSLDKDALLTRYKDIGSIKEVSQLYHEVLDDLSFRPSIAPKAWLDKVNNGVEKAAKITGNSFSEEFTRFVSADVMRQISEPLVAAGKLTAKEQNAYISTFVNRVQGNYVTSQRPILFQGTSGAAISLFQTYAFNVLQQLHRHMQAGDKKTMAIFAGLQGSVFGMNGLPFFDAVNTHLIGGMMAGNPQHKDAYSVLPTFNKELGDWLLYGTASAFPLFGGSSPALFTRGDINPRHISIVPTNIADVPAVSASMQLVGSLLDTGKQIGGGVNVGDALLFGLEHQGINRPLAGFAQLLAGHSTTSKGALISAASDFETTSWLGALGDRLINYGGVSRLAGARPMDEAVALNAIYRQKTYDAMDRSRIERLGMDVKAKLHGNQVPDDEELEDFMLRYTRSGGRVETFNRAMQQWSRDANVSVVNQLASKMGNPYAQKLQDIMGGEALPDYRNAPQEQGEE